MIFFFWLCVGVVCYTYIAYPIIVATLARFRCLPIANDVPTMGCVSVILVVRNEAVRVETRIRNLCAQQPAGIVGEILVVSDGSDDATDEVVATLAKSDTRIRLLRQPESQGKAVGVSVGVKAASNDIVVFADARQSFLPDTVARLLSRFADPDVGAVAGELRFRADTAQNNVAESVGAYWQYEVWIRRNEARFDSVIGCSGAVYAARRTLVRPMPAGLILDDVWVPMNVAMQGKRVAYEAGAIAEDVPSDDLDREFGRKVRTQAGVVQLVLAQPTLISPAHDRLWWMFISHKLMRLVVPYALIGSFLANLAMPGYASGLLLSAQCLFYGLGLIGFIRQGRSLISRICSGIKVFLSINAAAAMGTFYALTGRSHMLWRRPTQS